MRATSILTCCLILLLTSTVLGDGKLQPPVVYRDVPYRGSLEERAQEAILIFRPGTAETSARQDMILKISVTGEVSQFSWIIPLCNPPDDTGKEDARLFEELHGYVQRRLAASRPAPSPAEGESGASRPATDEAVEVIERKLVGSYDVAIVREKEAGALNDWLKAQGYQPMEDAEDVLEHYRRKGFVYACVRVSDAALEAGKSIDLHPLRFSFETGGRDGIFFPMRLTGLQKEAFDVNLYVFYDKWINDKLNDHGFTRRGFSLRWRDFDSRACTPNAGKHWANPAGDPYLRSHAARLPTLTELFKRLHPEGRFYLTNLHALRLDPAKVRDWPDDLWMFPYYTDRSFTPFDAREGGPAWVRAEPGDKAR